MQLIPDTENGETARAIRLRLSQANTRAHKSGAITSGDVTNWEGVDGNVYAKFDADAVFVARIPRKVADTSDAPEAVDEQPAGDAPEVEQPSRRNRRGEPVPA